MALTKTSIGRIGQPRLFLDLISYAKAIGYISSIENHNCTPSTNSEASPFDLNFSRHENYICNSDDVDHIGFKVKFKNYNNPNANFAHLLQSINYCGLFGHNLLTSSLGQTFDQITLSSYGVDPNDSESNVFAYAQNYKDIVGGNQANSCGQGYTIFEFDGFDNSEINCFEALKLHLYANNSNFNATQSVDMCGVSIGRYVDLPHDADLSSTTSFSYDGIKTKTTMSGKTVTNINYYRPSDWGKYSKWTHVSSDTIDDFIDTQEGYMSLMDNRATGMTGRRSWQLSFSFIAEKEMYPLSNEGNMFAYNTESGQYITSDAIHLGQNAQDSIVGTILTSNTPPSIIKE